MSSDYIPARDEDFLTWATAMSAKITANPTSFSLVAADATALAALVTSFTTAMAAVGDDATKTKVAVAVKDTARIALTAEIRALVRRIQASASVTVAQKVSLGLNPHDTVPSPTPAPGTKPVGEAVASSSRNVYTRWADQATPTRRARPAGASGLQVFSWVAPANGALPPADLEQWRFEGLSTRSSFTVGCNAEDVGKQIYVVARWYNRKGEVGPASDPIVTIVVGTMAA